MRLDSVWSSGGTETALVSFLVAEGYAAQELEARLLEPYDAGPDAEECITVSRTVDELIECVDEDAERDKKLDALFADPLDEFD